MLAVGLLVAAVVLVLAAVASLAVGARAIDPSTVVRALVSYDDADELYGLPLPEFTPARDARAKELKGTPLAAQVKALRKPSTAAGPAVRARPAAPRSG